MIAIKIIFIQDLFLTIILNYELLLQYSSEMTVTFSSHSIITQSILSNCYFTVWLPLIIKYVKLLRSPFHLCAVLSSVLSFNFRLSNHTFFSGFCLFLGSVQISIFLIIDLFHSTKHFVHSVNAILLPFILYLPLISIWVLLFIHFQLIDFLIFQLWITNYFHFLLRFFTSIATPHRSKPTDSKEDH